MSNKNVLATISIIFTVISLAYQNSYATQLENICNFTNDGSAITEGEKNQKPNIISLIQSDISNTNTKNKPKLSDTSIETKQTLEHEKHKQIIVNKKNINNQYSTNIIEKIIPYTETNTENSAINVAINMINDKTAQNNIANETQTIKKNSINIQQENKIPQNSNQNSKIANQTNKHIAKENIAIAIRNIDIEEKKIHSKKHHKAKNATPPIQMNKSQKLRYRSDYSSLLFSAIDSDNTSALHALIENGADINVIETINSYTPLLYSILHNKNNSAYYLIAKGANVNLQDNNGRTPIHIAISKQNIHLSQLLIESGADIMTKDKYKKSPLDYLSKNTSEQFCLLLSYSYKKNTNLGIIAFSQVGAIGAVKYLIKNGANIDSTDSNMNTPLIYAVMQKNEKLVSLLVENNANIEKQNIYGEDAKSIALSNSLHNILDILKTAEISRNINKYQNQIKQNIKVANN